MTSHSHHHHHHHHHSEEEHKILCCLCGVPISPNPSSMCISCIRTQVDISENISKMETILFCRECERYLQPPKFWLAAKLESRELMSFCLKRIKGLNKVKLIDANWIWTEPHSRRLKIKVTVQSEVFNGAILQQSFVVDFVVKNQQCESCQASYTTKTWTALVQLRQKVNHKRTFFHLEQLILKHHAHEHTINIKERPDGIDFYFNHRGHAQKFNEFVSSLVPCKTELAKRLQTHDDKNNIYTYKYTFSSEIAPICREDIVCLPKKIYSSMGALGPVLLCIKINTALYFLCPRTLRMGEISGNLYWKAPFRSLMDSRHLVEYTVLDIEPLNVTAGKRDRFMLAEAQVVRTDELGNDDKIIFVNTHLGNVLNPGDTVMGYDIANANTNDDLLRKYKSSQIPDVILCHKVYPRKQRKRKWHLKKMKKTDESDKEKSGTKAENTKRERDNAEYERFLQELEEDEDMRKAINLYRKKDGDLTGQDAAATSSAKKGDDGDDYDSDEDDDDIPEIADDELQDEDDDAPREDVFGFSKDDTDLNELEDSMRDLELKFGETQGRPGDSSEN